MKEELDPNKKTILVVDDEKPIIDILVYNLKKEGYNTLEATDGEMGINVALEARPDLILLDVMLPKVDGLTVCNRVKQVYNVPILMISARDEEVDKIVGLELGADDYITKPFSVRELMARVKANLRKNDDENNAKEKKKDTKIVVGDLELDLEKVEVKVKGEVFPYAIEHGEIKDGVSFIGETCNLYSFPRYNVKQENKMIKESQMHDTATPNLEDYNKPDF